MRMRCPRCSIYGAMRLGTDTQWMMDKAIMIDDYLDIYEPSYDTLICSSFLSIPEYSPRENCPLIWTMPRSLLPNIQRMHQIYCRSSSVRNAISWWSSNTYPRSWCRSSSGRTSSSWLITKSSFAPRCSQRLLYLSRSLLLCLKRNTHMKLLLRKEIAIMNIQLGTTLKTQKT